MRFHSTLSIICLLIVLACGCKASPPKPQSKELIDILRDAVKHSSDFASDKETVMILQVAARAFGDAGDGTPMGDLTIHSTVPVDNGQRKLVASWRREMTFKLEPRIGDSQEISWTVGDATAGTSIDLTGVSPDLADVATRLRGAMNLLLSPKDPLQQALTLSGFPDQIRISEMKDEYSAVVETAKAEFIVDDTKLIRAQLQK